MTLTPERPFYTSDNKSHHIPTKTFGISCTFIVLNIMTALSAKNISTVFLLTLALVVGLGVTAPVGESAPDGLDTIHELDTLAIDVEVAENENGQLLNGVPENNTNGTVTYNVTINAQNPKDVYPYIYPVKVEYRVAGSGSLKGTDTVYMSPTRSPGYVPDPDNNDIINERELQTKYQVTIPFEGVTENVTVPRTLEVSAESRLTTNRASDTVTSDVKGPIPAGTSGGLLENRAGLNEPSSVTFVDTYRISPSADSSSFQESTNLPRPTSGPLSGSIQSFPSMKEDSEGGAVLYGDDRGLRMVTLTRNIDSATPQTFTVTYNIETGDSNVTLNPLTPGGEEINEDTQYNLTKDPNDNENCRTLPRSPNSGNLCIFTLEESEVKSVNRLGELLLQYEGSSDTRAAIYCQSVVSGYMTAEDRTCGTSKAVTSPDIVTIESFKGYHPPDESPKQWRNEVIVAEDGSTEETELNMRLRPQVTGQSSTLPVKWEIYSDARDISSTSPKFSGEFSDATDPSASVQRSVNNFDKSRLDPEETYTALLCPQGSSSCTLANSYDSKDVTFITPSTSGEPVLRTRNGSIILEPDSINSQIIGEKRIETTDPRYDIRDSNADGTPDNPGWDCVRGPDARCAQGSSDNDFTGKVVQDVTVEDVTGTEADRVRNGQLISRAEDKRSSIEGGSWDSSERVQRLVNPDTQVVYATESNAPLGPGWKRVSDTSIRSAETGRTTSYFGVQGRAGFATVVESETEWYPLRGDDFTGGGPENPGLDQFEYQNIDPDKCLNCLPAETVSQAEERLSNTDGASLVKTLGGSDLWVKTSDEPFRENSIREEEFGYEPTVTERSAPAQLFNNISLSVSTDDSKQYLYRNSIFREPEGPGTSGESRKPIYEWKLDSNTPQVQFERPVSEPVYKYKRTLYDAEYTFRGVVTSPEPLYVYAKEVNEEVVTYKEKVHWFDISESYVNGSGTLTGFEVSFDGSDSKYPTGGKIDWSEEVHNNTRPTELTEGRNNITAYCDNLNSDSASYADLITVEIPDIYHGDGGRVVTQNCPASDGTAVEDKVVRIGKYYDIPEPEGYSVNFTLYAGSDNDTDPEYVVNVTGKDKVSDPFNPGSDTSPSPPPAPPRISFITPINEKVDYRAGTVAISGFIGSDTEELPMNGSYRLTVKPADDIDTIGSCSELSDYETNRSYQIQSQTVSGDTLREVVRCEISGFYDYTQVPEEFVLYEEVKNKETDSTTTNYKDIPVGAIQDCLGPLTNHDEDGDGTEECVADAQKFDTLSSNKTIAFGGKNDPATSGSLQSVEKRKMGQTCPAKYEKQSETSSTDTEEITTYSCVIVGGAQFELKSRQISVRYENVRAGVIQQCDNIPTSSETSSTHSGYEEDTSTPDSYTRCQLVDASDSGPDEFNISEKVVIDGDTTSEPKSIPAGAVRGETISDNYVPPECNNPDIVGDQNAMKCDVNGETIRYGSVEYGNYLSTSSTTTSISNQADSQKTVWRGSFVLNGKEQFTTTINPRNTSYSLDSPGSTNAKFTFKLRDPDGNVIETENIDVTLCRAKTLTSIGQLPLEQYPNGCEDFDTLLDGTDTLIKDEGNNTIADAIDAIPSSGTDTFRVHTMANDACPYNRKYPRQHNTLRSVVFSGGLDITLESTDSPTDIRDKVQEKLQSRYAVGGTLCNDDDESINSPSKKTKKDELTFEKESFTGLQTPEDRDFIRTIGTSELHFHTVNPAQTDWNDYRGAIRLGSPLLGDISVQPESASDRLELISHYPFDHNPAIDKYRVGIGNAYPNQYVIQDVYHPILQNTNTGVINGEPVGDLGGSEIDRNVNEVQNQVYQARLWYTSSCNSGSDSYDTQKISGPQAADGLDSAYRSCAQSPEVTTTSPASSPQLTQDEVVNSDYWENNFQVNGQDTTSDGVESPLANQGAFLYAPPTEQMEDTLGGNTAPYDRTSIVEENYDDGIFGGKALELNTNSWMMLTPPCMDATAVENRIKAKDNLYNGECDGTEGDVYRGGYSNAYDTPPQSASGYRTLYDEIQSKNGDDNSYTVSFWVKEGNSNLNDEFDSLNPTTIKKYDPSQKASNEQQPFNTLMSVSIPAHAIRDSSSTTPENTADQGFGNRNLQSSARISVMRTPTSIDVSDLGGPFSGESDAYPEDAWIYGSDTNLRSRFENCISTDKFGTTFDKAEEPEICQVWYQHRQKYNSNGEPDPIRNMYRIPEARQKGQIPEQGGGTFDYDSQYNNFLNAVYERIEWRWSYSYPVEANSVRHVESELPSFDDGISEVTDFPTKKAGHYPALDSCEMVRVKQEGDNNIAGRGYADFTYHGKECYQDSTYLFRQSSTTGGSNVSPIPKHFQDSGWTHVAISYNDGAATTSQRDRGTLSIYINGVRKGQAPSTITDCTQQNAGKQTVTNCRQSGEDPHSDGTGLDTGRLYENGVISIGGHYQAAGYSTDVDTLEAVNSKDGLYVPMVRASSGNVFIDEMRVYSGSIVDAATASGSYSGIGSPSVYGTMAGNELPRRQTVQYADGTKSSSRQYVGEIKTARQSKGDVLERSVSTQFKDSSAVRVSTTAKGDGYYEIGVIPCTTSECYESAEAVVSNRERIDFGGGVTRAEIDGKLAQFDTRVLERNNVNKIEEVRLRVKMATPTIELTPKIQQISVRPVQSPVNSCQGLQEEYDSFSGNRNETVDVLIDGQQATVQCDFETQDGGWTKFAWFDQGQVNNTESIGSSTTPLSSQISLADCSPSAEECFATPDFKPPSNVNLTKYDYADSAEELNGQILIKAKDDGDTVDWAAIEFEKFANYIDLSGSGITAKTNENLGTNETMSWAENASIVLENGEDNVDARPSEGLYSGTNNYSFSARPPNNVGDSINCLYPYAHGEAYSSTSGRCLTSYAHTATSSSSVLHLAQMRKTQTSPNNQEEFTYVRMVREQTDSGLKIKNLECLGKTTPEIDSCEIYYSTGHAFNTTEPSSAGGSFDFSEDTLNIDPSYYWTADSSDIDFTSSPETMFDNNGLIDLTQNADSNTGTVESVDGFDGSTREAISLGGGDNGAFNYTQSSPILDDQKTTVVGHFKPTDTGTVFEVGYEKEPASGPLGGVTDPSLPNPIKVELKNGGSTIEVKLRYLREDPSRSTSVARESTMSSSVSTNSNGWSHFGVVWDSSDPQNPRATLYVNGETADDLSSSEILQTDESTSGLYTADKLNDQGGVVTVGATGDFYEVTDPESYGGSVEEIIVTNGEALLGCEVESMYEERLKNGPTDLCSVAGP